MTQSLSYATIFLNPTTQDTEQQEEVVEVDSIIQEAIDMEESEACKKKFRLLPRPLLLKNLRKDLSREALDLWESY